MVVSLEAVPNFMPKIVERGLISCDDRAFCPSQIPKATCFYAVAKTIISPAAALIFACFLNIIDRAPSQLNRIRLFLRASKRLFGSRQSSAMAEVMGISRAAINKICLMASTQLEGDSHRPG
jgi:hypothetical protein